MSSLSNINSSDKSGDFLPSNSSKQLSKDESNSRFGLILNENTIDKAGNSTNNAVLDVDGNHRLPESNEIDDNRAEFDLPIDAIELPIDTIIVDSLLLNMPQDPELQKQNEYKFGFANVETFAKRSYEQGDKTNFLAKNIGEILNIIEFNNQQKEYMSPIDTHQLNNLIDKISPTDDSNSHQFLVNSNPKFRTDKRMQSSVNLDQNQIINIEPELINKDNKDSIINLNHTKKELELEDSDQIIKSIKFNTNRKLQSSQNEEYQNAQDNNDNISTMSKYLNKSMEGSGYNDDQSSKNQNRYGWNSDNLKKNFEELFSSQSKEFGIKSDSFAVQQNNKLQDLKSLHQFSLNELAEFSAKLVNNTSNNSVSTARLLLKPDSLGTVFVEVRISNEIANVRIKADSLDSAKAIESQIGTLKEKLTNQGIKHNEVIIEFRHDYTKDDHYQNNRNNGYTQHRKKEFLEYLKGLRQLVNNFSI